MNRLPKDPAAPDLTTEERIDAMLQQRADAILKRWRSNTFPEVLRLCAMEGDPKDKVLIAFECAVLITASMETIANFMKVLKQNDPDSVERTFAKLQHLLDRMPADVDKTIAQEKALQAEQDAHEKRQKEGPNPN